MTQDEIIRMAREAGVVKSPFPTDYPYQFSIEELECFAALVAAHEREKWEQALPIAMDAMMLQEREACAKVCDDMGNTEANMNKTWRNGCSDAAAAIRARGEK